MMFTARQPSVTEHHVVQWNVDNAFTVLMTLLPAATKLRPRLCFLHVSVILSTGGEGGLQAGRTPPGQAGRPPPPGQAGRTPPDQAGRTPLGQAGRTPPRARQGEPPLGQAGRTPPRARQGEPPLGQAGRTPPGPGSENPPWARQGEPPRKQTPEYGLRAAGTHPTGMHSCSSVFC